MPNIVERLFENVLSDVPDVPELTPEWTDDLDGEDYDTLFDDDDFIEPWAIDGSLEKTAAVDISDQDRELLEGAIRIRGLDALAFYKSRRLLNRQPYEGRWGIFYLSSGVKFIADCISNYYMTIPSPVDIAHKFLQGHESYHYRSDLQTLMFEAATKRSLYMPLRRALKGRRSYFVEEALANQAAWKVAEKYEIQDFAEDFMDLQPNAYSRFREPRKILAGEWALNVLDQRPLNFSLDMREDIAPWVDVLPSNLLRRSLCPEYLVKPTDLQNWIDPAWIPPPVKEIRDDKNVQKILHGKYRNFLEKWESTKRKLIENRFHPRLDFKKWPKEGNNAYSVRVDGNKGFRAHLRNLGDGNFETYNFNSHSAMGHG